MYSIQFAQGTSVSSSTAVVNSTNTTVFFGALQPNTSYAIRVKCWNGFDVSAGVTLTKSTLWMPPGTIAFQLSGLSVSESAGTVTMALLRFGGTAGALTCYVSTTASGTAVAGVNFVALQSVPVVFSDLQVASSVNLTVVDDLYYQAIPLNVTLGVDIGSSVISSSVITLLDNGDAGSISITAVSNTVVEGNAIMVRARVRDLWACVCTCLRCRESVCVCLCL